MNIVFMGTPDFARESLEAIYQAGHNIVGVVTNPDRPKGRGMKLLPSEVKEFALENLYKCAEEFSDKKYNCWMESKYNLRFEYVYDENEPYMELKYIPVSWEK